MKKVNKNNNLPEEGNGVLLDTAVELEGDSRLALLEDHVSDGVGILSVPVSEHSLGVWQVIHLLQRHVWVQPPQLGFVLR